MKDSEVFPACRILIGQFKFQVRQPCERGLGAAEKVIAPTNAGLPFVLLFSSPEAALLLVSTKNHVLWEDPIFGSMRREFVSYSQPFRFVRLDSEYTQSDGKSVDCGVLPRGRNSWC